MGVVTMISRNALEARTRRAIASRSFSACNIGDGNPRRNWPLATTTVVAEEPPIPFTSAVSVYNGTSWAVCPIHVYDGTSWSLARGLGVAS